MNLPFGPIQRDVPAPDPRGELRRAIAQMQPGESRVITGYKSDNIRRAAQRNGAHIRVRAEGEGFRIWRIS